MKVDAYSVALAIVQWSCAALIYGQGRYRDAAFFACIGVFWLVHRTLARAAARRWAAR